jgi:hypothetical protein
MLAARLQRRDQRAAAKKHDRADAAVRRLHACRRSRCTPDRSHAEKEQRGGTSTHVCRHGASSGAPLPDKHAEPAGNLGGLRIACLTMCDSFQRSRGTARKNRAIDNLAAATIRP